MSRQAINNGDTGLEVRNAINANFEEIYKFPKIHVENFGAVGDGVTNDSTAILAAFAYAKANGIKNVEFSPKDYYVDADLDITGLNIFGNDARLLRNYLGNKERIHAEGTQGDYHYVTEDILKGRSWIKIPAELMAEISEGDIVKILTNAYRQPEAGEDIRIGEMHKVHSIDSVNNIIYFHDYMFWEYLVADNARVCKVNVTTGSIRDLSVIYPVEDTEMEVAISISYAEDYIIENVKVENAYQHSILIGHCYRPIINAKTFNSTMMGYGYGVGLGGATMYGRVTGVFIGHRHCFTTTGSSAPNETYGGVSWGTIVFNAQATSGRESSVPFDTHASTGSITFQNCIAYGGIHREWEDVVDWDVGTAYNADDFVIYENHMYQCKVGNTGVNPATDYDDSHWVYKPRNGTGGFNTEAPEVWINDCQTFDCAYGVSLAGMGGNEVHINGLYCRNATLAIYAISSSVRDHLTIRNVVHDNDFQLVQCYTCYLLSDHDQLLIENVKSRNARTLIMTLNETLPDEIHINNIICKRDNATNEDNDTALIFGVPLSKRYIINNITAINLGVISISANVALDATKHLIMNNVVNFGALHDPFRILHACEKFYLSNFVNDDLSTRPLIKTDNGIDEAVIKGSFNCKNIFDVDPTNGYVNTYYAEGGKIEDADGYDFENDEKGTNLYPIEKEGRNILKGLRAPENNITAFTGTMYIDKTTGYLYLKQTGTGNIGWIQVT